MAYREQNSADNVTVDASFDTEFISTDVQAAIEEIFSLVEGNQSELDWQNSVLGIQVDGVLDPGVTPTVGDRYLLEDVASIHANFGTITGVGDDDIVEYDGSAFFIAWNASAQGEVGFAWNNADDTLYYFSGSAWASFAGALDHGSMTGLGDDDHTIYSLADGTRAFTGTVGGITPVAASDLTTKGYVDSATGTTLATTSVSATYTVLTTDRVIVVDVSGGSLDIDLPVSPADGEVYTIKDDGSASGSLIISIDPGGSLAIDDLGVGVKKTIKTKNTSLTVVYDVGAGQWWLI